eukprot:UN03993
MSFQDTPITLDELPKIGDTIKWSKGRFAKVINMNQNVDDNSFLCICTTINNINIKHGDLLNNYNDDTYINIGETVELISGKIGTIRFEGLVDFAKGIWIGVELHETWGPHDGAVQGVRYFSCPPKRGIFVNWKQIKCICINKDDITRRYRDRRCPECFGKFNKMHDPGPLIAYKGVGIICDGCEQTDFFSTDWYFHCRKCEQTDFCLSCMLELPVISKRYISECRDILK